VNGIGMSHHCQIKYDGSPCLGHGTSFDRIGMTD